MNDLITLENHVNEIYHAAAANILNYTPQLYVFKPKLRNRVFYCVAIE